MIQSNPLLKQSTFDETLKGIEGSHLRENVVSLCEKLAKNLQETTRLYKELTRKYEALLITRTAFTALSKDLQENRQQLREACRAAALARQESSQSLKAVFHLRDTLTAHANSEQQVEFSYRSYTIRVTNTRDGWQPQISALLLHPHDTLGQALRSVCNFIDYASVFTSMSKVLVTLYQSESITKSELLSLLSSVHKSEAW